MPLSTLWEPSRGGFPTAAILVLLFLFCLASTPAAGQSADQGGEGESARVWEEEDGQGRTWVKAEFRVDAPPEEFFALLLDVERFPEFMPEVREAKILEAGEGFQVVRFHAGSGLFKSRHVLRRLYDTGQGTIRWTLVEGTPRALEGSWTIDPSPEGGGSLVRYAAYVDPGFWVPDSLARHFQKRTLPGMISSLQRRVLGGGR